MDAKQDIQKIIDYSHDFAEIMLNEGKEYYPFGVAINNEGELVPVAFEDEETDMPDSQKVIDILTLHFETDLKNKNIRAYSLTYDVRMKNEDQVASTDAVLIDIVHRDSPGIPKYYFTYSFTDKNVLIFGESFGMKR